MQVKSMNFIQKIIKLLNNAPVCFHDLSEDEHYDLSDYLRNELPKEEYLTDCGVTKFVIIPADTVGDYVIKIPFSKKFDEDAFDDAISDYYYYQEMLEKGEMEENEDFCEPLREDFFYDFEMAYRREFKSTEGGWDYCALETALYEEAVKRGLAQYFAKEEKYGIIDNIYPIYIQQKVDSFYSVYDTLSKEERADATERCSQKIKPRDMLFDAVWVDAFLSAYGAEEYKRLVAFLDEFDITDFHRGNIGFYKGLPILFDYSGFEN